jgi:hypothetical protein
MARAVFLILVLANLAIYVWAAGYLGGRDEGREPERLQNQLQPEHLKVSLGETAAVASAAGRVCQRVGPLGASEVETLDKSIAGLGGQAFHTSIDTVNYWVYIPAVDGKPPERSIAALRDAGFRQFSVMQEEGPNHNAVTFGLFPSEQEARDKIARLERNQIKPVKLAEVNKPTGKFMLIARGTLPVLEKALAGLKAEPVECPKR